MKRFVGLLAIFITIRIPRKPLQKNLANFLFCESGIWNGIIDRHRSTSSIKFRTTHKNDPRAVTVQTIMLNKKPTKLSSYLGAASTNRMKGVTTHQTTTLDDNIVREVLLPSKLII